MAEPKIEKKKRVRLTTKYPLPSNDVSLEKHLDILKAYVVSSKEGKEPVSYNHFKTLVDVHPTQVSKNNKFFENMGFIKNIDRSKGTYIPQDITLRLYNALKWDKKEEVAQILKEVLVNSWFWESAKQLIELKGSVSKKELRDKIGFDSSADPKKHGYALSVLIDYLVYAGILKDEDGKISFCKLSNEPKIEQQSAISEVTEQKRIPIIPVGQISNVIIGILINPEMSEEQIRKVIRIVIDELNKN